MKYLKCLSLLLLSFFIVRCSNNPLDVDVSSVNISPVTIDRLEQDIFKMDTTDINKSTEELQKKYGKFYQYFIVSIINNGGIADSSYSYRIKQFISDKDMKEAYKNCQELYPSTDEINEEITNAFKHYKYYFPNRKLPRVITMMSGFNQWNVVIDSTLAIGLEMYLGTSNIFYKMLGLPVYKTNYMNKENVVPDAIRTWLMVEFPDNMDKNDFLSNIIYMGKIMYLSEALMPNVHDTTRIQYTRAQMDYCTQNEFNIWSYFTAQKIVYTTDQAEIMKFTSEGPFTSALSKQAPPRIGYWVGWQIVKQYIENNPEITLEQLMNETDAQKILTKAKYKPKK